MPVVRQPFEIGAMVTTGTTALVLDDPGGQNGDLIIVAMAVRISTGTGWDVASRPAGFTWIVDNVRGTQTTAANGQYVQIGWRWADGTEPASWSFLATAGSSGKTGVCVRIANADTTSPIVYATTPGANATGTFPAVTAPESNTLWLGFLGYTSTTLSTDLSGTDDELLSAQLVSTITHSLWQRYGLAAGSTGTPTTAVGSGVANGWVATTIAVAPGAAVDADLTYVRASTVGVEVLRTPTLLSVAPGISAINRDFAPETGSDGPSTVYDTLVLTGWGFTGATAVKFGTTDAVSFTVNSDTQITATIPAHAAGEVGIVVTSTHGDTNAFPFTYITIPSVASVTTAAQNTTGTSALVLTKPTVDVGDLLVFSVAIRGVADIIPPAGLTVISELTPTGGSTHWTGYRIVDGTEPADWTFNFASGGKKAGAITRVVDADPVTPILSTTSWVDTTGSVTWPGITTVRPYTRLLGVAGGTGGSAVTLPPTADEMIFSSVTTATNACSVVGFVDLMVTPGATGDYVSATTAAALLGSTALFAIQPPEPEEEEDEAAGTTTLWVGFLH